MKKIIHCSPKQEDESQFPFGLYKTERLNKNMPWNIISLLMQDSSVSVCDSWSHLPKIEGSNMSHCQNINPEGVLLTD